MPEFYGVLTNLANAPEASAQVDVSLDTSSGEGAPIDVTVFRADGARDDFQILTNHNGFATTASTKDLFVASAGQNAIVQVRTPAGIQASTAIFRLKVAGQRILLGVPTAKRAGAPVGASTGFSIALGDVAPRAFLFIANVSAGLPAAVTVHVGSLVYPARFSNPDLGVYKIWQVALTAAEAQTHLIVWSSVPVVVYLVVHDGTIEATAIMAT